MGGFYTITHLVSIPNPIHPSTELSEWSLEYSTAVFRIIDHQGWNIQAVADNFVAWLESDPPDIGNTCRRGITRYRDSGELFGLPHDEDAGNGACMHNLPVVLTTLNRPDYFSAWSLQQSHITHNNPLSNAATLTLDWGG